MNSIKRMRAALVAATVLLSTLLGSVSMAQAWIEEEVRNQGNTLSWSYPVLFPNASLLLAPDPSIGDVSWGTSGNQLIITFTPVDGAVGTAEFVIEHFTGNIPPQQVTKSFRIFVDSSHVLANEDYVAVPEGSQGDTLAVLANDAMDGGESFELTEILVAPRGDVQITVDGQALVYTPPVGFSGMTYLTYLVCDNYGSCAAADVSICVLPGGELLATDTLYYATSNKSDLMVYLPAEGFALTQEPQEGEATEMSSETWKYAPDEDFIGTDTFVLESDSLVRVVSIDVFDGGAENSYAIDDEFYTRVDSVLTFDVRDNDLKVFPIHTYSEPDKGTLTVDDFGVFTYTPEPGYKGAVEFTYSVKPLNGLEVANVIVHVGHMPPKNIEIYDLVTPVNTPLLINYQIPLEDYDVILTGDDEEHGNVILYNGYRENVQVGCDMMSGYDMIVYTPDLNYVGTDQFRLEYCVSGLEECTEFWINVHVEEFDEMDDCYCQDNCVWPGDTDANGVVDMKDLVLLGKSIGETGSSRNYLNNSAWHAQYAEEWESTDPVLGTNLKHADSNGDGIVSEDDTLAIYDYYLSTHDIIPDATGLKSDYQFTIIPPEGPLDSGDLAVFQIALGTSNNPVVDLEGLHFSLNLPEVIYQPGTADIFFDESSWITHDAPNLEMHMEPYPGRLDVGFSRVNGAPASGAGQILTMTFIVVDDIDGFFPPGTQIPMEVSVTNIGGLGSDGRFREIDDANAIVFVRPGGHPGIEEMPLSIDDKLYVYPNPASGNQLRAHLNGNREITTVEVFDMTGQMVTSQRVNNKQALVDIADMHNGTYVLRVIASDGVITRTFQVVR